MQLEETSVCHRNNTGKIPQCGTSFRCVRTSLRLLRLVLPLIQCIVSGLPENMCWSFLLDRQSRSNVLRRGQFGTNFAIATDRNPFRSRNLLYCARADLKARSKKAAFTFGRDLRPKACRQNSATESRR